MASRSAELGRRIRELRRRHFGARGSDVFADRLGVPLAEYKRYEQGVIPDGALLVRMCELTGEDLQWLLTGVSSRATLVISGARGRHQQLLARIAEAIDRDPALARPIEALLDLLLAGQQIERKQPRPRRLPGAGDLIPVLRPDELPPTLDAPGQAVLAALPAPEQQPVQTARWQLAEPDFEYDDEAWRAVELVVVGDAPPRRYVRSPLIGQVLESAFAVEWHGGAIEPMFFAGDVLVVWPQAPPKVGRAALLRLREPDEVTCGIWLGAREGRVYLGQPGRDEPLALGQERVCWGLDVLYCVRMTQGD